MLYENAGSYTPDFAAEIDRPDEIAADRYGVSLDAARMILSDIEMEKMRIEALVLGKIVGWLLQGNNPIVRIYALCFAAGLDQLNGLKSQAQAAEAIGCTRANLSHYVSSAQDALKINNTKFRKSDKARTHYKDLQCSKPAALINEYNRNKQKK